MKKFISLMLSLIIFSTMFVGFGISADAAKYCHLSKYKNTYKKLYKSSCKDKEYMDKSQAFYWDFDSNGQKELVILAPKKKADKIGAYLYVYTIKKGKVKAVKKGKKIVDYKGEDNSAQIGRAKKKGKEYLFVRMSRTISETKRKESIKLYSIKGNKAKCKYTALSTAKYDGEQSKWNVNVKLNNKKKSNSYFMKWQKKLKLIFVSREKNKKDYEKYLYNSASITMKDGKGYFKINITHKNFNPDTYSGGWSSYTTYIDGTTNYSTENSIDEEGRYIWDEFGNCWTDKDLGFI